MKIAVASDNGFVFQHFGHTQEFALFTVDNDRKIVNETRLSSGGVGHGMLASVLDRAGVDVLICGSIGGGALTALADVGIRVVAGASGPIKYAVHGFLNGTLPQQDDYTCHRHDVGHVHCNHGDCH